MIVRDDIPLGSTYDANGYILTHRDSTGYWSERTYDANGNQLTFKNSKGYWFEKTFDSNSKELTYKNADGHWEERTYDSNGNMLMYKNSDGFWYEKTYDSNGNELTFKNSYSSWVTLANDVEYILRYSGGIYWAGCRNFNREEAIKHWGAENRSDERAKLFLEAILKHQPN
jgi:hypothetical protein